jgi:hypothetical protein
MFTMTHIKTNYFLTDKDLVFIKHIRRNNNYNSKAKLKLFLKTDVEKYISKKYTRVEYQAIRKNKIDKKVTKSVSIVNRFHFINSILFNIHSVSLDVLFNIILPEINEYTNRGYIKFIKGTKISPSLGEIVEKCLEFEFIHKFTTLDWVCFYNFDELLLFFMLSDSFNLPLSNNYYISGKIQSCFNENREKFHRKKLVIDFFKEHRGLVSDYLNNKNIREFIYHGRDFYEHHSYNNKMYDLDEYDYIYGRNCNIDDIGVIKRLYSFYVLENFIYDNTDVSSVILDNMISSKKVSRFTIYTRCLKKYSGDIVIPKMLIENFLIA